MLTRITRTVCAAGFGLLVGGCGAWFESPDRVRASLGLDLVDLGTEPTYLESKVNDELDVAEPVILGDDLEVIAGAIRGSGDVDVYDLGPVLAGDRVLVTHSAANNLKAAMAVFDETGAALLVNDHQNIYLGQRGPFVDVVFRRPSQQCFVAVTATPGFPAQGDYVLGAAVSPGAPLPSPRPDTILLDFDGGRNVRIGTRSPIDVPRFDAADIDTAFDGMTDLLMEEVVRRVREDFAGLDVSILSTSEGAGGGNGISRLHFGAVDYALLGVAESVDEYNATRNQRAIVFVESFSVFMRLTPSLDDMAQALANVASHEIGHLLGLVHTEDPVDIMDVTASLNQLLRDQTFGKSPIYRLVFPIGDQDSGQLLLDSIGGDAGVFYSQLKIRDMVRARSMNDLPAKPAREFKRLGSCGCADHADAGGSFNLAASTRGD